jgi:DNA polymerase-3 subunit alpha
VQPIVAERIANGPYKSIFDLTERLDSKVLTRGSLELLIKAGALDGLGGSRAQLMAVVERAVQSAATLHRDRARGQKNLFGGDDEPSADDSVNVSLPEVPDWPTSQKLAFEKEVLGFYLTSHPLAQHAARLRKYASHRTPDLKDIKEGERPEVLIGGMISAIKKATTKKGGKYANFDFEDDSGSVRCIIWPEQFAKYGELVKAEQIGFVQGKVEVRGSEPNLIVDRILTVDEAEQEFTQHLAIQFRRGLHTPDDMVRVRETLRRFPGKTDVVVVIDSADEAEPTRQFRYVMSTPSNFRVACNGELRQALQDAIGESYFQMHAVPPKRGGGSVGR